MSALTIRKTAWAVLGALMLVAAAARAAEVTRVVTALDQNDTFDFNLTATWFHDARSAAINREQENATSNGIEVVRDLKYARTTDTLDLRADFGVLWDVGLHVDLPIVLHDSNNLTYDSGVGPNNSTFVLQNIYPAYNGTSSTVFQSPTRSGLQYLGVGAKWAVFNQRRDDTKPTWTLNFDADLDVFKDARFDPANPNGNTAVGLGYHQLIWSTWVSKRFRYFDPFFGASYMAPIRTNGSIYQDLGGGQTQVNPQQLATVVVGVEQIAWENPNGDQRVTVELDFHMQEHFAGRGMSELWEPLSGSSACPAGTPVTTPSDLPAACRPSLDVVTNAPPGQPAAPKSAPYPGVSDIDAYGSFGGDVGLNVQVGKYIRFRSLFGLTVDAPHFITDASAGIDRNGNGLVESNLSNEANPVYRESIDIPGRRFRVEESKDWRLVVEGSLMF
ncbi:MAG TPA: hypothetical protein VI456_01675 [Polyangia bacterium]